MYVVIMVMCGKLPFTHVTLVSKVDTSKVDTNVAYQAVHMLKLWLHSDEHLRFLWLMSTSPVAGAAIAFFQVRHGVPVGRAQFDAGTGIITSRGVAS